MRIEPVTAFDDNYIWLLVSDGEAVCIDPGQSAPVAEYLQRNRLRLAQIWITHLHGDHTGGIEDLKKQFPDCRVFGGGDIAARTHDASGSSVLGFAGCRAEVWAVPGHTDQHLAYLLHGSDGRLHVFCGDTLFSAGCGRVFSGTAQDLYRSLQRFDSLPPDTLFYPAHEYTAANLDFAAHIEPDNSDIAAAQTAAADTPTLPVTLAHERRINPFLRIMQPAVRAAVRREMPETDDTPEARFAALRDWKNRF
ncbi:hydroxyacylglutathione hydrolase [Neisseria leonii]|uniref:hydroxyacylglutathione hydrolase n=1 Tax=Neisseria leonii TaxID=2995413 RepID=UPI00237A983F|nr:hydroxyacylglutathione hydrolase [Neisseria sp. 3986]MDD9324880.1 hydroxyacylglutathione hydrolase [Neisseria sp. 3986]